MKIIIKIAMWLFKTIASMLQSMFFFFSKPFNRLAFYISKKLMRVGILKKVPYVNMMFDESFDIADYLRRKDEGKESLSNLRRGDLEAEREEKFPKERFPLAHEELYVDLDVGEVVESRQINNKDTSKLSLASLTNKVVNYCFHDRALEAIKDGVAGFLLLVFLSVAFSIYQLNIGMDFSGFLDENKSVFSWNPMFNMPVVATTADTWSTGVPFMDKVNAVIDLIAYSMAQAFLNPFFYIIAAATSVMSYFAISYTNLVAIAKEYGKAYLVTSKQEQIAHRLNTTDRDESIKSLLEANEYMNKILSKKDFDKGLLIGHSTGQLRARGANPLIHMDQGSPVYLTREQLSNHVQIQGNSGTGKTTRIFKRLAVAVAGISRMGMMILDYKADLPDELGKEIRKMLPERAADILTIGPGKGEYGINLIKKMRPDEVVTLFRSIIEQSEKDAGSDYFDKAAYILIEHGARLLQAWRLTRQGREFKDRTGRDPYNFMSIVDVVGKNNFRYQVCRDILHVLESNEVSESESASAIRGLDIDPLLDSINYMGGRDETTWGGMSDKQKSGVIGTFQTLVGFLKAEKGMREAFFEGRIANSISMEEAVVNHKILLFNVSSEKSGIAGVLTIMFSKTQLYMITSARQPELKLQRLDPQIESPFTLLMDEAQNFVTAGELAMSDAKVVNTARSTGLSLVFSFQNRNSVINRVGDIKGKDMLANMSTEINLTNNEPDTGKYVSESFGDTTRLMPFRDQQFENFSQAAREFGQLTPIEFEKKIEEDERFRAAIYVAHNRPKDIFALTQSIEKLPDYETPQDAVDAMDSVPRGGGAMAMMSAMSGGAPAGNNNAATIAGMDVQEAYRADDKREQSLTSGNRVEKLIPPNEVSELPAGYAIISYKTNNHARKEIIKLLPGIYS